jgi:hypothetical protein
VEDEEAYAKFLTLSPSEYGIVDASDSGSSAASDSDSSAAAATSGNFIASHYRQPTIVFSFPVNLILNSTKLYCIALYCILPCFTV